MNVKRGPAVATSARDQQKNVDRCTMMKQKALRCLETLSELVKEECVARPFSSGTATEVVVAVSTLIDKIQAKRRWRKLRAQQRAIHRSLE